VAASEHSCGGSESVKTVDDTESSEIPEASATLEDVLMEVEEDGREETPCKTRAAEKRAAVQSPNSDELEPHRQRVNDPVCPSQLLLEV
jgi:hypothetical protein